MPSKLVDYLLQPIINRRHVQVSQSCLTDPDSFLVGKVTKNETDLQLALILPIRTSSGYAKTLRTLIDTGAEVNLIKQGVLDSYFFRLADDPVSLVTANGQYMSGGTRTVDLEISFTPSENGNILDKKMKVSAICYEADISVDLILSFPWLEKK